VSNLECVVDLTQKQLDPKITGKLRLNVLFDRETKEEKKEAGAGVIRFEEYIKNKCGEKLIDGNLDLNIRYCHRERHQVGTIKTGRFTENDLKEIEEDFGYNHANGKA
jgi:flagellar hook assembly protein FlgD